MLTLSHNPLAQAPEEFGASRALQVLSLERCALTPLPEGGRDLPELEDLALGDDALTVVPDAICRLPAMEFLALDGSRVARVLEALRVHRRLRSLDVSRNPLEGLAEGLGRWPSLQALWLEK